MFDAHYCLTRVHRQGRTSYLVDPRLRTFYGSLPPSLPFLLSLPLFSPSPQIQLLDFGAL